MSLHIAVGVLRRGRQVLISQRREGKPGAGQWEFPGGKCEPGESIQAALRRELVEELGIHLKHCQRLIRLRHRYPDREVLLDTWLVDAWSADPTGLEGQAVRWVDVCELSAAGLLEADSGPTRPSRSSTTATRLEPTVARLGHWYAVN